MKSIIMAGAASLLLASGASAAVKTYDFTLAVNGVGSPGYGVTGPSDGPFHGSFSVDLPAAPDHMAAILTLTHFSVTIGTESWVLADIMSAFGKTDAAGNLTLTHLQIDARHLDATYERFHLEMGYSGNLGWYVTHTETTCIFDINWPYTGPESGSCFGGGPTDIVIVERLTPVSTPAALPLLASALAGMGFALHRRRSQQ